MPEKRKAVMTRLEQPIWEKLAQIAKKNERSISWEAAKILREHLKGK